MYQHQAYAASFIQVSHQDCSNMGIGDTTALTALSFPLKITAGMKM